MHACTLAIGNLLAHWPSSLRLLQPLYTLEGRIVGTPTAEIVKLHHEILLPYCREENGGLKSVKDKVKGGKPCQL